MTLIVANVIAVMTPALAFAAGVYFAKWMGDRRRHRSQSENDQAWYREIGR